MRFNFSTSTIALLLTGSLAAAQTDDTQRAYLPLPTAGNLSQGVMLYEVRDGAVPRVDTVTRRREGDDWSITIAGHGGRTELRMDASFRTRAYRHAAASGASVELTTHDSTITASIRESPTAAPRRALAKLPVTPSSELAMLAALENMPALPKRSFGTYLLDPYSLTRESQSWQFVSEDSVNVPAGRFATIRIQEPGGAIYWIRADAPHVLVKAEMPPGRTLGAGRSASMGPRTSYELTLPQTLR